MAVKKNRTLSLCGNGNGHHNTEQNVGHHYTQTNRNSTIKHESGVKRNLYNGHNTKLRTKDIYNGQNVQHEPTT